MSEGFIPKHGGYKKLLSYRKAEIVYDATLYFCERLTRARLEERKTAELGVRSRTAIASKTR